MKILKKLDLKYFFYSCGSFSIGLSVAALFGLKFFYIAPILFLPIFLLCLFFKNFIKIENLWYFFLVAAFGAAFFSIYVITNYKPLTSFNDEEKRIVATVTDIEEAGNGRANYILRVKKIGDMNFILPIFPVYIKVFSNFLENVDYSDKIEFDSELKLNKTNEHFPFFDSNFSRSYYLTGKNLKNLYIIKSDGLIKNILQLKVKAKKIIDDKVKKPYNTLAKGIFFGGSFTMPFELKRIASRCGIMHIFAVSGLHINILVSFLAMVFKFFRVSSKFSLVILFFLLLTYLFFVGFSVSAIRAVLMSFIVFLGINFKMPIKSLYALFFACAVILIYNPVAIYGISFLLSFSSCFGIIIFSKKIYNLMVSLISIDKRLYRYLVSTFSNSLGATIGCGFFLIFNFGNLSIFGPIVNLFVLPIVPIFYFASFLIILFGVFNSGISGLIGNIYFDILKITFDILKYVSDIPFCCIGVNNIYFKMAIFGIIFFVILCLIFFRKLIFTKTFFSICFNITTFSMLSSFLMTKDHTNIIAVRNKVESGVLIKHRGINIFLDFGLTNKTYERVFSYLETKGINKIDILFLTSKSKIGLDEKFSVFKVFPVGSVRCCGNLEENFDFSDVFNKRTKNIGTNIKHLEIFPILIDIKDFENDFVIYLHINGVCIAMFDKIEVIDTIRGGRYINLAIFNKKIKKDYEYVFDKGKFGQLLGLFYETLKNKRINFLDKENMVTEFVIDRNFFRKGSF